MTRNEIENYRRFVASSVVERPVQPTNRYAFIAIILITLGVVVALLLNR